MHEIWISLALRHIIVEQISSLRQEVYIRREIVVPIKHRMSALMLALKEFKIKSEAIHVQMHRGHIETQHLKDNNETPT